MCSTLKLQCYVFHTTYAFLCLLLFVLLFQEGFTPLIIAAQEGHVDIVKLLVESGADLNDRTEVCMCVCVSIFTTCIF